VEKKKTTKVMPSDRKMGETGATAAPPRLAKGFRTQMVVGTESNGVKTKTSRGKRRPERERSSEQPEKRTGQAKGKNDEVLAHPRPKRARRTRIKMKGCDRGVLAAKLSRRGGRFEVCPFIGNPVCGTGHEENPGLAESGPAISERPGD